jgi:phosphoribosylformylglycinamidine cyclo-ligase
MYEIFNMGIGMVLAVAPENLTEVLGVLTENDEKAYVIGSVAAKTSEKEVILKEAQA